MDDVWLGPHTIGSSRKITSPAGIRLVVTINLPTPSLSSTFQGKHLPSSSLRWSLRCSGEQAKTSPQAGQAEPTAPQKRQGPCFPPPMSGIFSLLIRFCLLFLLSCHFVRSTATASLKHLGIRPKAKVAPALTFSICS